MSLFIIVILLTAIILLSLSSGLILLFGQSKRRLSNLFLGLFLLVVFIQMCGNLYTYLLADIARYSQYNSALAFSFPPLLYLHVHSILHKKWRFSRPHSFHFTPLLIGVLLTLNTIVLPPQHRIALYFSALIYIAIILVKLDSNRLSAIKPLDNVRKMEVKWSTRLTFLVAAVFLVDAVHFLGFYQFGEFLIYVEIFILELVFGLVFFVVMNVKHKTSRHYLFGLHGLNLPFDSEDINLHSNVPNLIKNRIQELQNYMEKNQPFLNPNLTLDQLSQNIGIPQRELSELINSYLGTNFVSFVNSYRINLAKELLKNPKDSRETILEVMYHVGFSSKSSFNTLFKKQTGKTPTEFKKMFGLPT